MSVVSMKRIMICAMKKDRKKILEFLQRQGDIEITSTVSNDEIFTTDDRSSSSTMFKKNGAVAEEALAVLDRHAPVDAGLLSMFEGRKNLSVEEYEKKVAERDRIMDDCGTIISLDKEYCETKAEIPKTESELVAIEPWMNYDLPLDYTGTKYTKIYAGSLPGEQTLLQIETEFAKAAPEIEAVDIHIISASPEQTCISVICENKDAQETYEQLRKMGFSKPPVGKENPANRKKTLQASLIGLKQKVDVLEQRIVAMCDRREDICFVIDYFAMRADKYDVISTLAQSKRVFLLEGYVPERDVEKLETALNNRFDLVFESETPEENEEVPVTLSNNAFAEPVEGVIESYSMPGKGEIDPSMLVALFYYLFFGLMLSDAGYGLIMVIGCGLCLAKFKNMEPGLRKTMKMFFYCGISTTICGFLFGSFFGDAVNVVATTFFHRPDIAFKALWFEPVNKPMQMLVFSFAVGILHLFVGLGAKLYMCIRDGHILDGIFDVVFWYMLVGGAIVYLLTMSMITEMLGLTFVLPATAGKVAAVFAVIGAIGIILTAGRESKNWFKRLLKGLYGLYGVTSYLSDILSYSRLLALGLATSVISTVFNKMGTMVGDGFFGVIVFILVFLVGHTLNLAINALGAYVHTNRLQFVEFFGKFYEGGGKKFEPFSVKTKYFNIKEEI